MANKRPIVHIEIPAKDRHTSTKFYSELFGWELTHVSEPAPYTMGEAGNTGIGLPDVTEQMGVGDVLIYIASDDIEADLARIEKAGGKLVAPKMEVKGFGWFAIFSDPAGNNVALWKDMPR